MDFLIHHMLRTSAQRFPKKEALVHEEQRLTYEEVVKQTVGLAYGLRCAGLCRGDRIGIYLDASVPQVLSIFGVAQAGGAFVPINSLLFPDQVAHIARDCRMKGLITTKSKLSSLSSVLRDTPFLEFIVVTAEGESDETFLPTHIFEELCQLTPLQKWRDVGIEKDLAAILYT